MMDISELRDLIDRQAVAGHADTAIPRMRLLRSTGTLPSRVIYEPMLCVVAQGAKRIIVGDKLLVYGRGTYLVVSIDLPATGQVIDVTPEAPYLAVTLKLDRAALAGMLLELELPEEDDASTPGMAVSPVVPDLLDPITRLVRLLDRPRDIGVLAPMIEREILYRLLTGPQAPMLRMLALRDSRLSRVSRAIDWIRQNYTTALRVEAMAEVAGMSVASFHRHFKAVTAMSPLQFQKQIRLQEARRLILSARTDTGRIGFAVGYESASQFSREYSRFFGAPPARDAARLREIAAADPDRVAPTV